jgi:Immunity protein 74
MYTIIKNDPSSIVVAQGDMQVEIQGESFMRGLGLPDFIIFIHNITSWTRNGKAIPISIDERITIVDFVISKLSSKGWAITTE